MVLDPSNLRGHHLYLGVRNWDEFLVGFLKRQPNKSPSLHEIGPEKILILKKINIGLYECALTQISEKKKK
jgi:hypothetical protein